MEVLIRRCATGVVVALMVTERGMWQSLKDGTVNATCAVFETKVRQMNLTMVTRGALNQDARGVSLPVVLWIYRLKDGKPFATEDL